MVAAGFAAWGGGGGIDSPPSPSQQFLGCIASLIPKNVALIDVLFW